MHRKIISGIYKITSPSRKIYIGQSIDIKKRLWCYKSGHCKTQVKLHRSFIKYGFEKHTVEILRKCNSLEDLNRLEKFYIKKYKSFDKKLGLNLTTGGDNFIVSKESKERLSIQLKKKFKEDSEFYNRVVNQITSIDRRGDKNPKFGTGRKIVQFTKEGYFLKEYRSAHQVMKDNMYPNTTSIYNCCLRKPLFNSYKGFIWRFSDDCKIRSGKLMEKVLFRKIQSGKRSKYKGVVLVNNGAWNSSVYDTKLKKKIHLGVYKTQIDAARAQNVYFKKIYGIIKPMYEISRPFSVKILPGSQYKTRGVKWNNRNQFEARIVFKGKEIYIGGFYSHKEAAIAYNKKAFELHGDKAKLNIIK